MSECVILTFILRNYVLFIIINYIILKSKLHYLAFFASNL